MFIRIISTKDLLHVNRGGRNIRIPGTQWMISIGGFDATPCAVADITDGGGTTFDCYTNQNYDDGTMPTAGTGFDAVYTGDNTRILGHETFETYSDGAVGEGASGAEHFTNIYAS